MQRKKYAFPNAFVAIEIVVEINVCIREIKLGLITLKLEITVLN
jgi:hypothetical protein